MISLFRSGALRLSIAALIALTIQGSRAAVASQELAAPQGEDKKPTDSDLNGLRGRWSCRTGADDKLVVTWEFSDGTLVMTEDASALGENYGKQVLKGKLTLRPDSDPKEIDITLELPGSDEEVPPLRAIYVLDGDRLKLCYGRPGSQRPTRFPEDAETANRPQGEQQRVLEFRRVKGESPK
jgi:uncharacterized protein (TIGR03067 family)